MDIVRSAWRSLSSFVDALYAFLQRIILPALLLVLGGMVAGNLGQSFGITYLFWDQIWYRQLFVGLTLGLGFAHIIFIGFLLDYGVWLDRRLRGDSTREGHWAATVLVKHDATDKDINEFDRSTPLFLWYYYWFFTVSVSLAVIFNKNYESLIAPDASLTFWPLIAGFVITAGFGVLAISRIGRRFAVKWVVERQHIMHFWAGVVFLLSAVVFLILFFFGRNLPASIPVIVLFSLISGIYGFINYATATWRFDGTINVLGIFKLPLPKLTNLASWVPPVGIMITVGILFMLYVGGCEPFKYRFPTLAAHYDSPQDLANAQESDAPLLNPQDITLTETRQKQPFVIVSTSGGGITAAAWTVAVLSQLEDESTGLEDFPYAVRAITGASGGMVGAAYWNATLQPPGAGDYHDVSSETMYENVTADSLTPVVHQLVFSDIWQSFFSPWPIATDRGQVLEEAWIEATNQSMAKTLGDLYASEKAGWRPSLIFSPMMVEDGRRLVISNLDLSKAITNVAVDGNELRSISAVQLRQLFPQQALDWKLSTAARMNASFPYVSPAASLATSPRRRVVDAGYYDNYGINVAANWLMRCWDRSQLKEQTDHVIIIEIEAFTLEALVELDVPQDGSTHIGRALEGITSPVTGLLSAWGKRQSYRNDELLHALGEYLKGSGNEDAIKLTTVRFTNSADVSLSWILTPEEKTYIKEAADPTKLPELPKLQEAWK